MIRQFHTPEGIIERELTEEEIEKFANIGDIECKKKLKKKEYKNSTTNSQKISIIAQFLDLE